MGLVVLYFEVKDTGIGIQESDCERIFAPFTQVDGSSIRKHDGLGISLALCKQITYIMGGDIGVASALGAGSTFWFTAMFEKQGMSEIQLQDTEKVHVSSEILTTGETVGLPNTTIMTVQKDDDHEVRILYAEDNVVNQKVALHLLGKLGYQIDIVENGLNAVRALEVYQYDLVLMDCLMPVMDGLEATIMIRDPDSKVLNHNVPIIAVTANVLDNDRDICLSVGMDDYIPKPLKKDVLANTLAKWLK